MSPFIALFIAVLAASASALPATSTTIKHDVPTAAPAPAPAAVKAPPPVDPKLLNKLELATTQVDRFKILTEEKNGLVFNFKQSDPPAGKGGSVVLANKKNFPAVMDLGISAAVGTLDKCGMNTAHTHPRASEFLVVVEGKINSGFILENGLTKEVDTELTQYMGTVFPQGSIHYQFNPNCEPAVFVAGLNSDDPGASQIAQNFFALENDVVQATLGFPTSLAGQDIDKFRKAIPANVALGIDACLKKCKITKR